MKVGYVKKQKLPLKLINRLQYFYGKILVYEYEQGYVFQIPIVKNAKKMNKILHNLVRKMKKIKIDTIVFSDDCIDSSIYLKMETILSENNLSVLTGKRLMHYMNYEILEYILQVQKTVMGKEEVFFLIKKDDNLDLQFLSKFVENYKTVNIVTNDIERFKKVQNHLYEKEDILIGVSNNKNKALKRAQYVLNVNMNTKELEKYKINRNAIIINFKENVRYCNPTFNGININYFQINMPDEIIEQLEPINVLGEFDNVRLYEAILLKRVENEKKKITILSKEGLNKHKSIISDIIAEDNIIVTGLIGNNGKVCEEEFLQKFLTKHEN